MDRWLNVEIKGHAVWPTEETTVKFGGHELLLKPATRDTEQSIHVNLKAISNQDALTLINKFLSILSWCDGTSMENLYGFSGSVTPCPVSRDKSRAIGSCICGYPFYREILQDPKACLALALYREALTVNSVPFSFLSFFKILNILWEDKYKKGSNAMIEGIRKTLPNLKHKEALERLSKLGETEPDVPKYLYESGRCAIAHAYSEPLVDPDNVADLWRLSKDIWVIRAIAEHLIEKELKVSRTILG